MAKKRIRSAFHQDTLAERSKALAQGASPQGRGFEPHRCHSLNFVSSAPDGHITLQSRQCFRQPQRQRESLHHLDSHDTVSERLRRWTRNPLGSARRGSNPLGVDACAKSLAGFPSCCRREPTADTNYKLRSKAPVLMPGAMKCSLRGPPCLAPLSGWWWGAGG